MRFTIQSHSLHFVINRATRREESAKNKKKYVYIYKKKRNDEMKRYFQLSIFKYSHFVRSIFSSVQIFIILSTQNLQFSI